MSKFDSDLSEQLYNQSADEETGSVDELGWYALFRSELAIITETSQGFVYSQLYDTPEELRVAWEAICEEMNPDNDDE